MGGRVWEKKIMSSGTLVTLSHFPPSPNHVSIWNCAQQRGLSFPRRHQPCHVRKQDILVQFPLSWRHFLLYQKACFGPDRKRGTLQCLANWHLDIPLSPLSAEPYKSFWILQMQSKWKPPLSLPMEFKCPCLNRLTLILLPGDAT